MNYTLENFINYCNDMEIADEGFREDVEDIKKSKVGQSISKAIEWACDMLTKLYEIIRRVSLQFKQKIAGNKKVQVPSNEYDKMNAIYEQIRINWNDRSIHSTSSYQDIDLNDFYAKNGNPEKLQSNWIEIKKELSGKMKSDDTISNSGMTVCDVKDFYQNSIETSKFISDALNAAKELKTEYSKIDKKGLAITGEEEQKMRSMRVRLVLIRDQINLAKVLINMDSFFLKFTKK